MEDSFKFFVLQGLLGGGSAFSAGGRLSLKRSIHRLRFIIVIFVFFIVIGDVFYKIVRA